MSRRAFEWAALICFDGTGGVELRPCSSYLDAMAIATDRPVGVNSVEVIHWPSKHMVFLGADWQDASLREPQIASPPPSSGRYRWDDDASRWVVGHSAAERAVA